MAASGSTNTMFAIQIHTIKALGTKGREIANIFLDISSEGQRPRRYLMGDFAKEDEYSFDSIVHYSSMAVTLSLDYGPLRYHQLGVSTIFRFLQTSSPSTMPESNTNTDLPEYEYISFGRGGAEPSFQVCYSVRQVTALYQLALNEITCVKQVTNWRKDQLWADIEFNHSVHAIDRGPVNRYLIGNFNTHDISSIHSGFNLSLTSISNFVVTFYAKSILSETLVGVLKFTPLVEVFFNQQNQRQIGREDSNPATAIDWSTAIRGGLRMTHIDAVDKDRVELTLADFTKSVTTKKRLHTEVGGYEILFTVTRSKMKELIYPKTLWKRLDQDTINTEAPIQVVVVDPSTSDTSESTSSFESKPESPIPKTVNQRDLICASKHAIELVHQETNSRPRLEFGSSEFGKYSSGNYVELLIDGLQTFRRYYEMMSDAKHSISILGWEISLSFGLTLEQQAVMENPETPTTARRWITLEDVIISKAREGVKVRIVVWRHELLSHINRYLYLGDVTVEHEMQKLEKRCKKNGISVRILHATRGMPGEESSLARLSWPHSHLPASKPSDSEEENPSIVVIITGNPKGIISSHHEKLVLVDAECPEHAYAFTGGFDIARGRYDQPSHRVPLPGNKKMRDAINKLDSTGPSKEARYTGRSIQPVFRPLRFLWHDMQLLIKGPATRALQLHFTQRWVHAFIPNPNMTKAIRLPPIGEPACHRNHPIFSNRSNHTNIIVRLERTWKTVYDVHYLFEDYCKLIKSAEKFLYIEHQYPFQNFTLTQLMCEQLRSKPNLRLIVVTPIKTDLPTGIVGELVDWSQDHIIQHLHLIRSMAPERVGIYGLINQDSRFPQKIGGIYIHSKIALVDDLWMVTGSTNMDNISFFHSSELSIEMQSPEITKEVRIRLFSEHLGHHYKPEFDEDLIACFNAFRDAAEINWISIKETGLLKARPISLAPMENYNFILSKVYYPNKFTKLLMKLGLSKEDVTQVFGDGVDNVMNFVVQKAKL